mmetsp:Transcript_138306/g.441978  ORF Transcript_138306/g.441978 Transcript_138306/m.441978 type:complete len:208 (-) Transcript_138306:1696-2319(-)
MPAELLGFLHKEVANLAHLWRLLGRCAMLDQALHDAAATFVLAERQQLSRGQQRMQLADDGHEIGADVLLDHLLDHVIRLLRHREFRDVRGELLCQPTTTIVVRNLYQLLDNPGAAPAEREPLDVGQHPPEHRGPLRGTAAVQHVDCLLAEGRVVCELARLASFAARQWTPIADILLGYERCAINILPLRIRRGPECCSTTLPRHHA